MFDSVFHLYISAFGLSVVSQVLEANEAGLGE